MASVEHDTARKSFPSPSPGTAGLYIYRNTTLGGANKENIFIDGELVAVTVPMTYFYLEVQGGKPTLSTEPEFSANDLVVDVEKDKNYFVRQSIEMEFLVRRSIFELVPEEAGKKGVLECKLANNFNGSVLINKEIAKEIIPGSEVRLVTKAGEEHLIVFSSISEGYIFGEEESFILDDIEIIEVRNPTAVRPTAAAGDEGIGVGGSTALIFFAPLLLVPFIGL